MSKIFVVDDELKIRESIADFLSADGHEVTTMPTGNEMIEMMSRIRPDLVLLDLKMPGEKGLDLLRRMPTPEGSPVPVVIFSGHITNELECEAYDLGVIDVIPKAISVSQFRFKVNRILNLMEYHGGKIASMSWPQKLGKSLLIVDDEAHIRDFLEMFFSEQGFKVYTAENGNEALEIVKYKKPTAVLLDIHMPGVDGVVTLKRIKELNRSITVIMATGVDDENIIEEAIRLGAYDYVIKPYDARYLQTVVLRRFILAANKK